MSNAYDPVTEAGFESFPASDSPAFTPISGMGGRHSSRFDATVASNWQRVFKEVDLNLIPRTGQVHLALLDAERFLGLALHEHAAGRDNPTGAEVAAHLAALRMRLAEHRSNIEAEGSLADSVKSQDPWLISQLQHLLRHHDQLGSAILFAGVEYESMGNDRRAAVRVHRRAKSIAAALTTLLDVERALLMAQFCEPQAQD